jgi:hypothetical protein
MPRAMSSELIVTLAVVASGAALLLFAMWRDGKKLPDTPHGRRPIPWKFVMLLAGAIILLATVHAVNLMGFKTGNGRPY